MLHSLVRFHRAPYGTVALTFDGGPDPRWTPQLLRLLRREGVPATFFVMGTNAARYPGLVRAELRGGDEIGIQTFRPVDLGRQPALVARYELSLAETALAGAAGVRTSLLRPAYVATAAQLTDAQLSRIRDASRAGFLAVLADRDSQDWQRPGVAAIVQHSLPQGGRGAIIQLHDGGGRRDQSVAAAAVLISRLREQGYRFTTVSSLLGAPTRDGMSSAHGFERL
ncbi:MAG: polysaccharide deacetylase family protein, partial [Actinobacteria bacterium]|nr:polysaccharide deacetylase family protein [Actinomycetota bacterium]